MANKTIFLVEWKSVRFKKLCGHEGPFFLGHILPDLFVVISFSIFVLGNAVKEASIIVYTCHVCDLVPANFINFRISALNA